MRKNGVAIGGFSLLELMIVVAIIAILAAIGYPSYQDHLRKGRSAAAQAFVLETASREQQYLLDARSYAVGADAIAALSLSVPAEVSAFLHGHGRPVDPPKIPPTYLISAVPIAGSGQEADGELTLNDAGRKTRGEQPRMVSRRATRSSVHDGFTMIECMAVVAVIIALITVAAPGLSGMIVSQQLKNASFDLASTLSVARSEALTRNVEVTISPREDDWARGWTVADEGGTLLRDQPAYGRISVAGPARVTFGGDGRPAAGVVPFAVASDSADVSLHRCIRLRLNGRPYVTRGACS